MCKYTFFSQLNAFSELNDNRWKNAEKLNNQNITNSETANIDICCVYVHRKLIELNINSGKKKNAIKMEIYRFCLCSYKKLKINQFIRYILFDNV